MNASSHSLPCRFLASDRAPRPLIGVLDCCAISLVQWGLNLEYAQSD